MKKLLGIALIVAVALTLCLGTVALAADPQNVHTDWEFNGAGSIQIDTQSYTEGQTGSASHLYVETTGSYSSGWENVSVYPCGYYDWTGFTVVRYVEIGDGIIEAYCLRDNSYPYWPAYTEYASVLETDGNGFLWQSFQNTYAYAYFNTHIEADCVFLMWAGEQGSIGGNWSFIVGAEGDSSGLLDVSLTDRAEHNGWRLVYGSFYVYADPADAGFEATWSTLADFVGQTDTPGITQNFDVNVSGSGGYNTGASADWVTIAGYVYGMK